MVKTLVLEQFPFPAYRRVGVAGVLRHRIYIMPTRHGMVFFMILLASLLGAVNYNNSMAYVLTFLLSSMSLIVMLHTYRDLAGLVMNEAAVMPVFLGETAYFPLLLDNRNKRQRLALRFFRMPKNRWYQQLFSADLQLLEQVDVPRDQLCRVLLPYQPSRRGLCGLGCVKVATVFPLGLFQAWSCVYLQQSCVVYPKPVGKRAFPTLKLSGRSGVQGESLGVGMDDFFGFREYVAGDPIKDIAWKVYAQDKGLLLKQFRGCGSSELLLSWSDVLHLPDLEARLSQLCLWLATAEAQSLRYGLSLPQVQVASNSGESHLHYCLSLLAQYGEVSVV